MAAFPFMRPQRQLTLNRSQQQSSLGLPIALCAICLIYVLSYAPMYRVLKGNDSLFTVMRGPEPWQCAYIPIQWIMYRTPLREPLIRWAWVWDVDDELEIETSMSPFE
jgi:hypothetical protein